LGIGGGLAVIYLARILDGLTGGNISVAEAYASDISDEKSRTQALGLIGGANGLGHILGPGLAVLLSGISLIAPIIGAAIMSGVTLLLTIILLHETLTPEKQSAHKAGLSGPSMSRLLWRRPVWLVLSTAFVMGLYIAALFSTFSLYAERVLFPNEPTEVVVQKAGLMIIGVGLVAAVSQIFLIKPLATRWGEPALVVFGSVLLLVSAIGFGSATAITAAVMSILAFALGFAVSWPSLQAIMTRFGSKESAGRLLGLFQSAFSLALIIAPVGAGFVLESWGPRAIYYGGALLVGLATLLGLIIFHLFPPISNEGRIKVETPAEPRGFLHRLHH
jgi:DHA1 family tetracycline resistance protein-like MFS transporter